MSYNASESRDKQGRWTAGQIAKHLGKVAKGAIGGAAKGAIVGTYAGAAVGSVVANSAKDRVTKMPLSHRDKGLTTRGGVYSGAIAGAAIGGVKGGIQAHRAGMKSHLSVQSKGTHAAMTPTVKA